ncbi:putative membrane protein [Rhodobium orientis]|uniref:NnrU family protein n=1 Tax=Rhodobium orientis TaxID=34017 RepID=A0A327JTZ0_9HYPH|nr:NnrU family protein [Rhodobium orientis]MBB4302234.1 putative membrane protein [Rhodobium orientis]MBK5948945.1 NnrU family protein [Rhodobium orientis]RAI28944.1 NnrU family protein [Rhodobium orientis]
MTMLIIGLMAFLGVHLVPSMPSLKARLTGTLGANGYRAVHAVIALIGLVLIVWGFGEARAAGAPVLYDPPLFLRHLVHLLMLPVFILLISAYAHGRITRAVRHPMVLAVKLWAFAHLLVNGDLASVVLFGSFLAWGVIARISLARRERAGLVTVAGGPVRNDIIAIVGGLVIYGVFVMKAHIWLIGVPVF